MEKQFKNFETKIENINAEERTMVVTLTDSSIDRDNEVMLAKGAHWGEGKKMPSFLWAHSREGFPMGKFLWMKRITNKIKGKVQFAPTDFAMSGYVLYAGDYLTDVSIGFIPEEWEDDAEWEGKTINRLYKKFEIVEVSGVPVGSNRNAVREDYENGKLKIAETVYKSFDFEKPKPEKEPEKESEKKPEPEEQETKKQKPEDKSKEEELEKIKNEERKQELITFMKKTIESGKIDREEYKKQMERLGLEMEKTTGEQKPKEKAEEEFEDITKPYPHEHSCRLEDPKQFDKFRREKCKIKHDDKCIDVLYGIKENKSKMQAMRYNIDIWKEADAKAHCLSKKGKFEPAKPEGKSEDDIDIESFVGENEIDLDSFKKDSKPEPENSDEKEIISEEELNKLKKEIKESIVGEFRKKLGLLEDVNS